VTHCNRNVKLTRRHPGTGWSNTEFRSYTFTDDAENASIVETPESRELRAGTEHPLGPTEQMELRETTHKRWEQNGLIQAKV